jgi:hypothetical protein
VLAQDVKRKICKDCQAEGVVNIRPAEHPGPRCTTHHRRKAMAGRVRAHELHIESGFGITASEYEQIKVYQGGKCAGCQRATGATKALAVDHDHKKPGCDHPPNQGCRQCVRALLCGQCNTILGRYDVAALKRLINVLEDPPAQYVLKETR